MLCKGEDFMYKKVELPEGYVGMEKKVADLWEEKDVIKKNFDIEFQAFSFLQNHQFIL